MRTDPASPVPLRLLLVGAVIAAFVVAFLVPAVPAAADCAEDERSLSRQVAEAELVFVGTTRDVANRGRTATFEVHEVWRQGADAGQIGPEAVVHGGPPGENEATSVDRTFEDGQRYLVFPREQDGRLVDDVCTPTRAWSDELADARPPDARRVAAADPEGGAFPAVPVPLVVGGLAVLVVAVVTAHVAARRR